LGTLGEISRRGLSQNAGDDLISQGLKSLMDASFEISELRGLVPQLSQPLLFLSLQLLLHLAQDFINVLDEGASFAIETNFHTAPPSMCSNLSAT
jgi:hypothetical protein